MHLWIQTSRDRVIYLVELKWGRKLLNVEKRSKEIRYSIGGQVKKLGQNQNEIKQNQKRVTATSFFFPILVMNLVSYIRHFLVPMKDYIFLSFIVLHVVPSTLYSSINICSLIKNKSTKETKPILLDQRKQTFSLQPWHRSVLFGPHCFLYFNQLVRFKIQKITHKNPDFWILFKKSGYIWSRPLWA